MADTIPTLPAAGRTAGDAKGELEPGHTPPSLVKVRSVLPNAPMNRSEPHPADCEREHGFLKDALAVLDRAFRAPDLRERRGRLIEHGTSACAHARLGQHRAMRADLQAMLTDALQLPPDGPEGQETLRLRRMLRLALAEPQEDGADH